MTKKKKSGKVIKWIGFGSFPGDIMFCVGMSYDEIIKYLVKGKWLKWKQAFEATKDIFDNQKTWGYAAKRVLENTKTKKEADYFFLIVRNPFEFDDFDYTALAHEILHLCSFQLPNCFDVLKENEAFCYTHTCIMETTLEIMRKSVPLRS